MTRRTERKKKWTASVIIPAYNAAHTIQACLAALHQQTILPAEIIVVDDGSKDATPALVREYPRVKLITQSNQGPARARNVGAGKAVGDIIVFLDSDCVPEKNWLEEILSPFDDESIVGVQGAYRSHQKSIVARFDQLDIETRYHRMEKAFAQGKLDWIGSYSAAYRRSVFAASKGFDETFPKASGEDAELSYRLASQGKKLAFNPSAIVYHTHPETLGKYLKIKFFRAYWRMRMYVKFPQKMVADSYTPQSLKAGIIAGPLVGVVTGLLGMAFAIEMLFLLLQTTQGIGYALIAISGIMLAIYLGGAFILLLSADLSKKLLDATPLFLFWGPIIVLLRALSFGFGMLFGILDARVRA